MKKLILFFVFTFALMSFTSIYSADSEKTVAISDKVVKKEVKFLESEIEDQIEIQNNITKEEDCGICNGHPIDQTFIVMCEGNDGPISLIYEASICEEHLEAWHEIFGNWC